MRAGDRSTLALAAVFAAGLGLRAWNLFHYPFRMGFDAQGNWDYIARLAAEWRLPGPGEGWSTAHPPFFYAIGAAFARLFGIAHEDAVARATIALCATLGVAAIAATACHVGRTGGRRALLAAALLLFLPVHVTMSAMLSEEILVTALVSFGLLGLAQELARPAAERSDGLRPALSGALAGLGLLTKLSAAMPIAAGALALLAEAPRRGASRALRAALAFGGTAALVGGWFYVRNLLAYGYLYPHGLPVHAEMFAMPPGARTLVDYAYVPLAAFGPAQASDPALLHSVWGTLWLSIFFDAHRHFLPRAAPGLELAARTLLVLGLVPATAFAVGLLRGARRALREASGEDRLFAGTSLLLLAGFVAFTWRNPWFTTVKGSFLLGLSVPYAVYASETLERWMRAGAWRRRVLAATLVLFSAASALTFGYHGAFSKVEPPGTDWRRASP